MKSLLAALLKPMLVHLTEPLIAEAKRELRRILIALSLAATAAACIVVGLTYFASSLWHALVPLIGTVGADVILGVAYALIAAPLLLIASKMTR